MRSSEQKAVMGTRRRKIELYATAAIGGLSIFLIETPPSWAQSVNPGVSFAARNTLINSTYSPSAQLGQNSGTETRVQVNAPQAIIDWTAPAGAGAYDFIASGTTTTFYNVANSDYTVLNVLNVASGAARPMTINGSVVSRVNGFAGATGGNVWFYSPGGMVVSGTGSFDVGSLLLTTINPYPGGAIGQQFTSFNDGRIVPGTIGLRSSVAPGTDDASQIQIAPGSTLTAQNYIGIVAPRIVQAGTINAGGNGNAGGAVGLIAAEQVDLTIDGTGGLFSISVPLGSSFTGDAQDPANAAIVHAGTTTGSATGQSQRNMYFVAVPKNTAVSMLLGGTIGYDIGSATASSEGVLLLAGTNVGTDGLGYSAPTDNIKTGQIRLNGGTTITSNLTAAGTRTEVFALTGPIDLTYGANLVGTQYADVQIGSGQTLTSGSNLTITSQQRDSFTSLIGQSATVTVGGTLRLLNRSSLQIDARGLGYAYDSDFPAQTDGGSANGGTASLTINGGTIEGLTAADPAGNISVFADGFGGNGLTHGGDGFGGTASLTMNGGTLFSSAITVSAEGRGGTSDQVAAGNGVGNIASVTVATGTVGVINPTLTVDTGYQFNIDASGIGGSGRPAISGDPDHDSALAGGGTGGTASFSMTAIGGLVSAFNQGSTGLIIQANGNGGSGGGVIGGIVSGISYNAFAGSTGTGGAATYLQTGGTVSLPRVQLETIGTGGVGGDALFGNGGDNTGRSGDGGLGRAGRSEFTLSGTAVVNGTDSSDAASLTLSSFSRGGNSGFSDAGNFGEGGSAFGLNVTAGATVSVSGISSLSRASQIALNTSAIGGTGGFPDGSIGIGGDAIAGNAFIVAPAGAPVEVLTSSLNIDASASGTFGQASNQGSGGTGGNITLDLGAGRLGHLDDPLDANDQELQVTGSFISRGQGGLGNENTSGNGVAGTVTIRTTGGYLNFSGLSVDSSAGQSTLDQQPNGVISRGGDITIEALNGGSIHASSGLSLNAIGFANGSTISNNDGTGGNITLNIANNGLLDVTSSSFLQSSGYGGSDPQQVVAGGIGTGGDIAINLSANSVARFSGLSLYADGHGGDGGVGGAGNSGTVQLIATQSLLRTSTISSSSDALIIRSFGESGNGSGANLSNGGAVTIRADSGQFQIDGNLLVDARGNSGTGGAITIEAIGDGTQTLALPSFISGSTILNDPESGLVSNPVTGAIAIRNLITGTNDDTLSFGNLNLFGDAPGGFGIDIATGANALNAVNVTLASTDGIAIAAGGTNGFVATGDISANSGEQILVSAQSNPGPTLLARNITFEAPTVDTSSAYLAATGTAGNGDGTISIGAAGPAQIGLLQAVSGIDVSALGNISIGSAVVTDAALGDGSGGVSSDIGTVRLDAGQYEGQYSGEPDPDARITITGSVSGRASVQLFANGTIEIAGSGNVLSDNGITVNAGDDLTIATGGVISANRAPVPNTFSDLSIGFSGPAVHSIVSAGTIDAGANGGIRLYADAIDLRGGTVAGSSVTFGILNPGTGDTDGGLLTAPCLTGTICIGNVFTAGTILVDNSFSVPPSAVAIAGTLQGASLDVTAAGDITLGDVSVPSTTITLTGVALINAGSSAILGAGPATIQGSSVALYGADLLAPNLSLISRGNVALSIDNSIALAGVNAAGQLGRMNNGFIPGLQQTGSISIDDLSIGTGDVSLVANGISIIHLGVANEANLTLDALSSSLTLNDGAVSGLPANVLLRGATVDADRLAASGEITLEAGGSVTVGSDIAAATVNAMGDQITLNALGSLNLANLSAGSGGATVTASGPIALSAGNSGAGLSLTSTGAGVTIDAATVDGGAVVNAAGQILIAALDAGSLDLRTTASGIDATTLVSRGTTTLVAAGAITLPSLSSAGLITAAGGSIDIRGGALSFASASALAGDVTVRTTGPLSVSGGSATGSALFRSDAALALANYAATLDLTLQGNTIAGFTNLAGRNVSLTAGSGSISGTALSATGTTFLSAPVNASISALNSAGGVTVNARGISLFAPGAMTVTSASAGVGGMTLSANGQLTVASATSARDIVLESTNGGITAQTISSATTTSIRAPGAATVASLTSTGNVDAQAGSLQIASPVALTFSRAVATNGGVNVSTPDAITVLPPQQQGPNASATGDSSFLAGGQLTLPTFSTSGNLTLRGNGVAAFTALSGNNVSVTADSGGLSAQALTATGTTSLTAPGAIDMQNLRSAGAVTAMGSQLNLISPDALTVANFVSNSGDVTIRSADLLTASGNSAGALSLTSTGAGLTLGTVGAAGAVSANAAGPIVFGSLSGDTVALTTGAGGISGSRLFANGEATLSAPGAISIANDLNVSSAGVSGGSIAITSTQDLVFSNLSASSGDAAVTTTGTLTIANGSASGNGAFTSGGLLTLPSFAAGGDLTLQGSGIGAFTSLTGRNVSLALSVGAISGQALTATGTTSLVTPGAIDIATLRSTGAVTASGSRMSLTSPDTLTIASFTTTQGDAAFRAANLLTAASGNSAGALSLTSTGAGLTLGTVGAAGAVSANAAGPIAFTQVGGNSVSLVTTAGGISGQRLTATNAATLSAPGAIAVSDNFRAGSASVSGATVALASTGDLVFSNLSASSGDAAVTTTGGLTVNGGNVAGSAILSSGATLTLGSFSTTADLILSAQRLPSFSSLSARNISLTALASDLTGGTLIASGTTTLSASGALTIADLRSSGPATLAGSTINVGSSTTLNVANAAAGDGGLRLRAAGSLTVAAASSTASVDLASTGGNVTVGTITMTGTPAITLQAVAGTSPLTIASAGITTLNGPITGAGAATISGTSLALNDLIDASGILLSSQTIAVGPQALIGTLARTGTVSFVNTGTGRSFIGGTGSSTGYSLDAAAVSRVQASSIALTLPRTANSSAANPDVVIGALTLYGTGAAAPQGSRQNLGTGLMSISTPGQILVNGAVRLANLPTTGTSGLSLRAAAIDVLTPSGSIVQTDAQGLPAGTLDLNARSVRVGSAAALGDVSTLQTPTARETRLASNDGTTTDTGFLTANTIRFAYPAGLAASGGIAAIYVQNSGGTTPDTRRGVTTGAGGIIIANFPANDLPEVFINGRSQTSATTFVTGTAFLRSISQPGTGAGATDILVNGCVLTSGACTGDINPATSLLSSLSPPQDLIGVVSNSTEDDEDEDTNKPGDPVPSKDAQAIVQFAPADPDAGSQTTDDPVIGAGNDSLWSAGGSGGNEPGAGTPFDTTVGIGNDAGAPDGGQQRTSGNGNASGNAAQPADERQNGFTQPGQGGLGVGNDAAGGGQRSGAGSAAGGAPGIVTPTTPVTPGAAPNGGAIGIGGDAGSPAAAAGGNPAPGSAQNPANNGAPADANGNRPGAVQAAPGQTTGIGGDAGGGTGGSGSSGAGAATGGAAGSTTNGAPNETSGNNRTGASGAAAPDQTTGSGADAAGAPAVGTRSAGTPTIGVGSTPGAATNPNNRQVTPNTPQ